MGKDGFPVEEGFLNFDIGLTFSLDLLSSFCSWFDKSLMELLEDLDKVCACNEDFVILNPGSFPSLDTGTSVFLSLDEELSDKDEGGGTLLVASLTGTAVELEPFLTVLLLTITVLVAGGAGPATLDSVETILTVRKF